ncbi:hypothetical protein RX795_27270, partial [Pseudomonas syringae pv. actinidiae]|nr:hypothetical protein [Pseudomonas syringae pv. actinidiae]
RQMCKISLEFSHLKRGLAVPTRHDNSDAATRRPPASFRRFMPPPLESENFCNFGNPKHDCLPFPITTLPIDKNIQSLQCLF